MRELAIEVLGEVPDQFVDYMVMRESKSTKIYDPYPSVPESLKKMKSERNFMSPKEQVASARRSHTIREKTAERTNTIDLTGDEVPKTRDIHEQINKHNKALRQQSNINQGAAHKPREVKLKQMQIASNAKTHTATNIKKIVVAMDQHEQGAKKPPLLNLE